MSRLTFNPCDECIYSYSKNNQEMTTSERRDEVIQLYMEKYDIEDVESEGSK